jgi:AcrR family transcriptional regulator
LAGVKLGSVSAARSTPPEAEKGSISRRRSLTEADILERSAALFAAHGYAATSVGEIADVVGMSRPSLYHYFSSKDEILGRIIDELADAGRKGLADADFATGPADEALARLVRSLLIPIAQMPGRYRMLWTADATFSSGDRDRIEGLQRSVLRAMTKVISNGVSSGVFRRCDQRLAAFSILGMINWTAWWYTPKRGPSLSELCLTITDFAIASVRAETPDDGGDQPASVIASIRRELLHLESLVGDD